MTAAPGMLRRMYDIVALFVLINTLAFGGLAAYLVGSGTVDVAKLRRVAAVLRGDGEESTTAEKEVGPQVTSNTSATAASPEVDNADLEDQGDVEVLHREAERIKVELGQRLALNNSILLKVRTEREAFKAERAAAHLEDQNEAALRRDVGFEKQVDIIESLVPKIAVRHLLGLSDPNEAAKILMAIETEKARKIVEAAKRGDDLSKMQLILQRMREAAPNRSAELDANGR